MKKRMGYYFFLISIFLLAIVTLTISYFDTKGVDLAPRGYSSCITPPAYPQLIMQSGTICPGNYNYGIGIGANNVNLKCSDSTFFGLNLLNQNGLLISGSYRNVTVEDCTFIAFPENGVYLIGPVGAVANSQKLTGILLKNITSIGNFKDGLQIRENTYQIDAVGGKYDSNGENGIHLISQYKDPLRYNVNPDLYPKYFPNDVRLFNATMSNNGDNGIYVDGRDYIRNPFDMDAENNTLIFEGNLIEKNIKNGIKNTDFFIEFNNQPWTNQGDGPYYILKNHILNNSESGIKVNTERVQTTELTCNNSGNSPLNFALSISDVDFIYSNNIKYNGKNGIEVTTDSYSNIAPNNISNNCNHPNFRSKVKDVYNNVIEGNALSGVYYHLTYPFGQGINGRFGSFTGYDDLYFENIIIRNGREGVLVDSPSTKRLNDTLSWWRESRTEFGCNDIRLNGLSGTRFVGSNDSQLFEEVLNAYFYEQNIIENNQGDGIGLIYKNRYSDLVVDESYIANNIGVQINHNLTGNSNYVSRLITRNDIIGSLLLAFDTSNAINWRNNYWSDYSPGCSHTVNSFYCDFPRPIPTSNQDTQPKVTPYDINSRGYLQVGTVGAAPLATCGWTQMPQYPIRPSPPQSNSGPINPNLPGGG